MSLSTNTTYRVYVDKLGASNPSEFIGDAGELFYDPNVPTLKLSDGSTPGGLTIAGGGGGGSGESYWVSGASGISTSSNVGIGTTNPQYKLHVVGAGTTALFVNGNARITGILSIGTNTITLDPTNNSVSIGTAITLNATTGTIEVQGSTVANPTGDANYTGIVTAAYFYGDGSNLTNVAGGGGAFSYCCTSNITSTNLTSHPDITTAYNNFFVGCNAGFSITDGYGNNFLGLVAGCSNTTGSYNNFFGAYSAQYNISGCYNNFFGNQSGVSNITGCYNNFFGYQAALNNNTGNHNVSIGGRRAGAFNSVGNYNIFLGSYTGISTASSNKIVLGGGSAFNQLFDSPDTTKDTQFAVGVRTDANPSKYWLVGNENFNVGIGTTNPQYKLDVGGDLNFTGTFYQNGVAFSGGGAFSYCCTTNITSTNLTSHPDITSSANNNFFVGCNAGFSITEGISNNFLGLWAGLGNTTGSYNNFFGAYAGACNISGCYNNFFGQQAGGGSNTTGCYNNFFGYQSGQGNNGNHNIGIGGRLASRFNKFGNYNIFLGSYTGISTASSNKIVLGRGSAFNQLFDSPDTTKDTQLAIGVRTDANPANYWLVGNENFNVGIGTTNPQYKLDVGGDVNFTGTLYQNGAAFAGGAFSYCCTTNITSTNLTSHPDITSSANNNFFAGCGAGSSITTGCFNTFIGYYAGSCNTDASYNIFLGFCAGKNNSGNYNNFFGCYAGFHNATNLNNFYGNDSGYSNTTGGENNFFGQGAGSNNTTGCQNNFFGGIAGLFNTIGNKNIAFGNRASIYNVTGNNNVYLGNYTGISTSSSNKIILGNGYNFFNPFDSPDTTKDTQLAIGLRMDANPANYWLVGNENFNIGIGTTNPTSKLTVGGDVKVGFNTSQGVILTSPNGTQYRLVVDNSGALSTVAV